MNRAGPFSEVLGQKMRHHVRKSRHKRLSLKEKYPFTVKIIKH